MRLLSDAFGVLTAYLVYPLAQRREKRLILPKLRTLRAEAAQPFSIRKAQAHKRLVAVLEQAGRTVPYYRELFAARGFDPASVARDIRYLDDLPCLTKADIMEQGRRLISENAPQGALHERKTGSSTGPAARIYYDQVAMDWTAAQNIQTLEWAGKRRYYREAHLSTRFLTPIPPHDARREAWKCFVLNRENIYTDSLEGGDQDRLWQDIRQAGARVVQGHPSSLYALARHLEQQGGIGGRAFDLFVSTGEMLTDKQRQTIERVLQCRVANRYGAAEFGVMAQETAGRGDNSLLVADSMVWPEMVAPNEAGVGELVFTALRNAAMPLIRYRMGDLGQLTEQAAGWRLTQLMGRVHDAVVVDGTTYPTHFMQDILDRCGDIQDFQIAVKDGQAVELRLVTAPDQWETIANAVRGNFPTLALRRIAPQELVFVGRRGKFRYLVEMTNDASFADS